MKFGVVTFPGTSGDSDIIYVLQDLLGQKVEKLWHKDADIKGVDMVILPGGFSSGDYLRPGAIATLSPIMNEIINHAEKGGYVFGLGNGFQILTEAKLLEGALLSNEGQRFINMNVDLKIANETNLITKGLDTNRTYKLPIAHGNGRYYAEEDVIKGLQDNNQILFQYASNEGIIDDNSNPNGSLLNIAGIQNAKGNVFGMMPHPERAADEVVGNTDGRLLLKAMIGNL